MLDLGHIAFRRDDTAAARRDGDHSAKSSPRTSTSSAPSGALMAASSPPFSSDPENRTASMTGGGVSGPGTALGDDPLEAEGGLEDVAQNDWRLDVTGVQVRRNRACGGIDLACG